MLTADSGQAIEPEALKRLREARRQTIAAATARMKSQKKEIAAIKAELRKGERTVPEIAAAIGLASAAILWYLATLKKYGVITEGAKDGSYFRYQLTENAQEQ